MPKVKYPLLSEGDSATMRHVVGWCSAHGLSVRRTSPSQIKVGPLNCWPDKGAWNRDDDPKGKKGGIPAFMAAVEEWVVTQALVPADWVAKAGGVGIE